jgi:hypothetical protein
MAADPAALGKPSDLSPDLPTADHLASSLPDQPLADYDQLSTLGAGRRLGALSSALLLYPPGQSTPDHSTTKQVASHHHDGKDTGDPLTDSVDHPAWSLWSARRPGSGVGQKIRGRRPGEVCTSRLHAATPTWPPEPTERRGSPLAAG